MAGSRTHASVRRARLRSRVRKLFRLRSGAGSRFSLFDALAAAIFYFILGDIGAHQLEMSGASLCDGIDVFPDEVLLSGARVELVFRAGSGARDRSGFLIEGIIAAGFHLDRLVPAGDQRSRGRAEDFERAVEIHDALFGGDAARLILVALHTASGE